MRHALAVLSALGVLASAAPALAASQTAGVEKTFLIPSSDGYGVAECLTTGGECGQVVADAWCESQATPSRPPSASPPRTSIPARSRPPRR